MARSTGKSGRGKAPRGNDTWDGDPDTGYDPGDWSGSSGRWNGAFYPATRPLAVSGGIKARSKRGAFGESWWSRRWVEVVESFQVGGRLARGKTYARSGQVASVRIEAGRALAEVQGSRTEPYHVVIALRPLDDTGWKRIAAELRSRPLLAALLTAGVLHEQLEEVFEAAGQHLFPTSLGALSTKCSCPDWSNPCKHVAAVFYLVAEELDRDGMLLLHLHGIERERLADLMEPSAAPRGKRRTTSSSSAAAEPRATTTMPLPADPDEFWSTPNAEGRAVAGDVTPPTEDAALARRLGAFPLWRGSEPFMPLMERRYAAASKAAVELAERLARNATGHVR